MPCGRPSTPVTPTPARPDAQTALTPRRAHLLTVTGLRCWLRRCQAVVTPAGVVAPARGPPGVPGRPPRGVGRPPPALGGPAPGVTPARPAEASMGDGVYRCVRDLPRIVYSLACRSQW